MITFCDWTNSELDDLISTHFLNGREFQSAAQWSPLDFLSGFLHIVETDQTVHIHCNITP